MIDFLRRQRSVLILGTMLIVGAIAAQVVGEHKNEGPPLSSRSTSSNGALALALWVERLGYSVERLEPGAQAELRDGSVLFVLQPIRSFTRLEAEAILSWVRRGGVFVYVPSIRSAFTQVSPNAPADVLNEELGLSVRFGSLVEETSGASDFFTSPAASRLAVHSREALELRPDDWTQILGEGDQTLAATRRLDGGAVYATVSDALFANEGIGESDNFAFVLNILARHPTAQSVVLEEAHHAPAEAPGLMDEMRARPWGWAVIYATLLTMLFLFWAGRRFGPAIVVPHEPARSSGEYVTAFAGLLQRARATQWAQRQLAQALRSRLARILGVRSDASPTDIAHRFGERYPIDSRQLAGSLAALDARPLPERQVLTEVRRVEELLRRANVRDTAPVSNPPPQGGRG